MIVCKRPGSTAAYNRHLVYEGTTVCAYCGEPATTWPTIDMGHRNRSRSFERNNATQPTFDQAVAIWMKNHKGMTNGHHVRALAKLWDVLFGWHAH